MIVVTGAAGFIGSCVVARLNELNITDLILVDHLESDNDPKKLNLQNKKFLKYYQKEDFLDIIRQRSIKDKINLIIHMGACSSTTLQDADYFDKNNFQYSCHLAEFALEKKARYIYASSAATYGSGERGYSDDHQMIKSLQPLNLYGWSKQRFDLWCIDRGILDQVVGLKFFNVFGPNEYHKADMRSVIAKSYDDVVHKGIIRLFKSYKKEYPDGGQKRDFLYVKDAIDILMFIVDHPLVHGIFNVGTGVARTWNDLAQALFSAVGRPVKIEYFEMPETLKNKYQYYTQADITKLRVAGYQRPMTTLESGVEDYTKYLKAHTYW